MDTELSALSWYAMKATGRVKQVKRLLRERGIYAWSPFTRTRDKDGKCSSSSPSSPRSSKAKDAYENLLPLLFFRATKRAVRRLHADPLLNVYIYRDFGSEWWQPLVIPPFEVSMFRMLREMRRGNYSYFDTPLSDLQKGERVRITGGDFAGLEGVIKRVKHNRQFFVSITGVCAVAVAYIPRCFVEPLAERSDSPARLTLPANALLREQEAAILRLSDRYNALPFARFASPEAFLSDPSTTSDSIASVRRALLSLNDEIETQGLPPSRLWLLFRPEEWRTALGEEN